MIGLIKKLINSDFSKPLNVLIGEQFNAQTTNIGNTYAKANESNVNAYAALQKGQEVVNMLNAGRVVKSVQSGIATSGWLPQNTWGPWQSYGANVGISPVNTAKALIFVHLIISTKDMGGGNRSYFDVRAGAAARFVSGSTLSIFVSENDPGQAMIPWQVIEFY